MSNQSADDEETGGIVGLLSESRFLLYQTEDDRQRIEVRLDGEIVRLPLGQIAGAFQVDKSGIFRHLKNIFETRELRREATAADIATVCREGDRPSKKSQGSSRTFTGSNPGPPIRRVAGQGTGVGAVYARSTH